MYILLHSWLAATVQGLLYLLTWILLIKTHTNIHTHTHSDLTSTSPCSYFMCLYWPVSAACCCVQRGRSVIYKRSNCCGLITSNSPEEVTRGHIQVYFRLSRPCYHMCLISDSVFNMMAEAEENYCWGPDKTFEKINGICINICFVFFTFYVQLLLW